MYVETLVGPHTINTMPEPTLKAVLDHGEIREHSIEEGVEEAHEVILQLEKKQGIDLNELGERLQDQGVQQFSDAFDSLMQTLEQARFVIARGRSPRSNLKPLDCFASLAMTSKSSRNDKKLALTIKNLQKQNFADRFFNRDSTLWPQDESAQKSVNFYHLQG